jgi:peptidoglycan hydrolase-like protein with peptidoglycan-binding domain
MDVLCSPINHRFIYSSKLASKEIRMSRYHITDSVGNRIETVHTYEDIAKHHPSSGREPGRDYEKVEGKLEEVRHVGGHTYIKKDIILATDDGSPVKVPAPASGYLHYLHDETNAVRIYDKPFGTPGATLLAQSLHMVRNSGPAEGAHVDYGAPIGRMGDTGSPGSIHCHLEMELGRFKQYIHDIDQGVIRPDHAPAHDQSTPPSQPAAAGSTSSPHPSSPANTTAPAAASSSESLIKMGEHGDAVRTLQDQLNRQGARDAAQSVVSVDGVFGKKTQESLENFQRSHGLTVDGIAGPLTTAALAKPPLLHEGDRGDTVRALQENLNQIGARDAQGRPLSVDGVYGPMTRQSVENFQRTHQLSADGIAGPLTFDAMARAQGAPAVTASRTSSTAPDQAAAPAAPSGGVGDRYAPTPLSNLIGRGEGGYNSYNRGHAGDSGPSIDFSKLTVGDVLQRQALPSNNPESLFAVGKFQVIPVTMREAVQDLHLDPKAHFTPALQEKIFADFLIDGKRPEVKAYITGAGGEAALGKAELALAREFASVADPRTGKGYYDGDSAGNHASITAAQTRAALDEMRQRYQSNVQGGMSPDQAYHHLGHESPQIHTSPHQATPSHSTAAPAQAQAVVSGVLREGAQGPDVTTLQQHLISRGALDANGQPISADGQFGARTREAVESFQKAHNLTADGTAGAATLSALDIKERPPVQTSSGPTSTVATGDGVVSRGGEFTPERRAFLDLIAWKEVPHSLAATSYMENNGVRGSTGRFTAADVEAGGGFPASAGSSFNVGRYQFNRGDWNDAKHADPSIKGYSPADQDKVALHKLHDRHVIEALDRGDLRTAIARGGHEWASLPGSPFGQVQKGYTVEQAIDYYNERLAHHRALDKQAHVEPDSHTPHVAQAASSIHVATAAINPPVLISDLSHPKHDLYRQAFDGVQQIDARVNRASDTVSENLAGALAAAAHDKGMTSIHHVSINGTGSQASAIQHVESGPTRQVAHVDIAQAIAQPLSESTRQINEQTSRQLLQPAVVPTQNPAKNVPLIA